MQRFTTAALTVLMAFSLMLSLSTNASANALTGGGNSSSYSGESVFTNQPAGGSGQFSAIFFNDGTTTWAPGVVGLLVCDGTKTLCNVASPNAAYASGWTSATVYATVSATVAPGSNGFFVYNFVVPAATPAGTTATFNGDVGLISTGTEFRPQGYFQINTTPGGTTGGMALSPTSAALPVGGQQQFTATGAPAGATVNWNVVGGCGAVTNNGLFAATATNSPTQPCSVTATAGGSTASAAISVFGPAASIRCSATKTTIPADAGTTITTIQGTLIDANGNVVANDNSTAILYTNNTPTILAQRNSVQPSPRTASNGVSSKDYIALATGNSGTGVISLSSGSLTGCSQNIAVTGPGAATGLATSFYLGTISANQTSVSTLEVDVVDANGVIVSSDSTSKITISRTTGASSCGTGVGGTAGSAGPTQVSGGTVYFEITATSTPGTCQWTATSDAAGVASSSATLTTVITGAPNKLAIAGNASPKAADGVSTLRVTVALQDASGNPDTTPADQVSVTATLGTGCTGTKADGTTGNVQVAPTLTAGSATGTFVTGGPASANTGSYQGIGTGETTNYARFIFKSDFATTCTVTFSHGATAPGATTTVSSTSAQVVFTAGGPNKIACAFSPSTIAADGAATTIGTVSMTDAKGNLATSGTFSASFAKGGGFSAANTTLLTASPQNTSNGIAQFSVKSGTVGGATDTYTATTTINGTSASSTCAVQTP